MFFGGVPAKIEKSEKKPTKEEEEQKGQQTERGKREGRKKKARARNKISLPWIFGCVMITE
jgi:hypothetical protein